MSDQNDASFPDDWENDFFQDAKVITKEGNDLDFPGVIEPKSNSIENNLKLEAKKSAQSENRNKSNLIRQFIQAFNEISPLVDRVNELNNNSSGFKIEIKKLFELQSYFVQLVGDEWSLDRTDINDKYIISILAKQISELIKSGYIESSNEKNKILSVLESIEDFIVDRPYIGQLIETNQLSDDILVNVKSSLFPSSLRFYRMLDALGFDSKDQYKWIKWHHNLTVNLAKDLAFNWDRTSSFKDRERLFENSLSHCGVIAQDVWEEHFILGLEVDLKSIDGISILSKIPEFEEAINLCDMGYFNHDFYNLDWIKKNVFEYLVEKSSFLDDLNISKSIIIKLKLFYISKTSKLLSKAWKIASEKKISNLTKMLDSFTEEESKKWLSEEGSKPMPISEVYEELDKLMPDNIFESSIAFDENLLLKDAKSKLAMLWGLSDAVCKIKRR